MKTDVRPCLTWPGRARAGNIRHRLLVDALAVFAVSLPLLRILVLPLRPRPHPLQHRCRRRQDGPAAHALPPPARPAAAASRNDGGVLGTGTK